MNTTDSLLASLHCFKHESAPFSEGKSLAERAIAEIERLSASQFRWIPFAETKPESDIMVFQLLKTGHVCIDYGWDSTAATHWARIPKLPSDVSP